MHENAVCTLYCLRIDLRKILYARRVNFQFRSGLNDVCKKCRFHCFNPFLLPKFYHRRERVTRGKSAAVSSAMKLPLLASVLDCTIDELFGRAPPGEVRM